MWLSGNSGQMKSANPAAAVDALIARGLHSQRSWRRATAQRRSPSRATRQRLPGQVRSGYESQFCGDR